MPTSEELDNAMPSTRYGIDPARWATSSADTPRMWATASSIRSG